MEQNYTRLAQVLIQHSCELQPGELIIIDHGEGIPIEMTEALLEEVHQAKGHALLWNHFDEQRRAMLMHATEEAMRAGAEGEIAQMKMARAYISLRGFYNSMMLSDVPPENLQMYKTLWIKPLNEIRLPLTKWVVTRWFTHANAQLFGMSTPQFREFFFKVCCGVNYNQMGESMDPLVKLMQKTDQVRIVGPDTDLTLSIKDMPIMKCFGKRNIPDGEVFVAPVLNSLNGTVHYNTVTNYDGAVFSSVRFEITEGRIKEFSCESGDPAKLKAILFTDDGARSFGEFAFGLNPLIDRVVGETLFDEKVSGSFHLTPGNSYEGMTDNGNRSAIHWDIVCQQDESHGGGQIFFDGKLVRDNGLFVPEELHGLNPENLIVK